MMVLSLLSLLLMMVPLTPAPPTGTRCPPVQGRNETCVCQAKEGVIDLTPLSNTNGTARFTNLLDPNDFSYSYNPCKPFTDRDCKNVSACQVSIFERTPQYYAIADAGTEQMWIDDDGTPYLYYTRSTEPYSRELRVYLQCDKSAKTPIATTDGDTKVIFQYEITIKSCQVCPGGCEQPPPPIPSISIPILCPPIPGEPSCICGHPNGIIDLTPYANVSGTATFSVDAGNGSANYYYNPCQAFRMSKCWNTHICMLSSDSTSLALANMGTEKIYIDSSSGEVFVQYTGPAEIPSRVYLECDHSIPRDSPSVSLQSNSACPSTMSIVLKSCQVCPGGC